jgi:hypothetical protein
LSKIRRFGGTWTEANEDLAIAQELFAELLDNADDFLWSYETMMLYGQPYFRRLYRFLNVDSPFEPPTGTPMPSILIRSGRGRSPGGSRQAENQARFAG